MDLFIRAREHAERTIKEEWRAVAEWRTFGWVGPIEAVQIKFPFVRTTSIPGPVSEDLPILIFQSRQIPPVEMEVAVPYRDPSGNPFNTRIVAAMSSPSAAQIQLLSVFSQSIWFLLNQGVLPDPRSDAFEEQLRMRTGPGLFRL